MPGDTEGEPPQTKSKSAIFLTRLKTILSAGIITSFILGVAIGALFFLPFQNDKDTVFTIETGSPLPLIAQRLKNEGLISNQYVFRLGVILFGNAAQLKAGEFSLSSRSSMYRVMHVLTEGKAVLHSVTIPEGLSNVQIHNLLANTPLLIGDITSMPPEGSLLPETYHFPRGGSRDALILQMEKAMRQTLNQLWDNRAPNLPLQNQDEALVLASIVEKETGVAAERALVASVFINRLNKNMRLQSDPTIIYGLKKGQVLGRPIRKS
ncbi:MAG: endolytic transglycosylase MltG, partial [Pseudomonadota bacterium]|nr:endolytic transglycosylase MltG [Pseudomonadota bacterium]